MAGIALLLGVACGRTSLSTAPPAVEAGRLPLDGHPAACSTCPHTCCLSESNEYFCAPYPDDCRQYNYNSIQMSITVVCACTIGQEECAWKLECLRHATGKVWTDQCFDTTRRCHWELRDY